MKLDVAVILSLCLFKDTAPTSKLTLVFRDSVKGANKGVRGDVGTQVGEAGAEDTESYC
jgi:hypothetical protein